MLPLVMMALFWAHPEVVAADLNMHGAGALSSAIRQAAGTLMDRSRDDIRITYRSLSSSAAAFELLQRNGSSGSSFSVTDGALSQAHLDALTASGREPYQILIGSYAVGFFVNIPGLFNVPLDACAMSYILGARVQSWSDPRLTSFQSAYASAKLKGVFTESVGSNFKLVLPLGHSEALGKLTKYLLANCLYVWYGFQPQSLDTNTTDLGVYFSGAALSSVVHQELINMNTSNVILTDDVLGVVLRTRNSIGLGALVPAIRANLVPVNMPLANNASGPFLFSSTFTSAAAFSTPLGLLTSNAWNINATWFPSSINSSLVGLPPLPTNVNITNASWPLTVAYYLNADSSLLGTDQGALFRLLSNYMLSDEGHALLASVGGNALSSSTRLWFKSKLAATLPDAALPASLSESALSAGLPSTRASFVFDQLASVSKDVATLKTATTSVLTLDGSGATTVQSIIMRILMFLKDQSKLPTAFGYRATGSGTGRTEIMGSSPAYVPVTNFGAGAAQYASLKAAKQELLQFPLFVSGLAIVHSLELPAGSGALNLTACTILRIYQRRITTWNDNEILNTNPSLRSFFAQKMKEGWNNRIVLLRRALGSGASANLLTWLERNSVARCTGVYQLGNNSATAWPADSLSFEEDANLAEGLQRTPNAIGYVSLGYAKSLRLAPVAIDSRDGEFLHPYAIDMSKALGNITALWPDFSSDFSALDFIYRPGHLVWPIVFTPYLYLRTNLSSLGDGGALVVAFARLALSSEVQAVLPRYDVLPIPDAIRLRALDAVSKLTLAPGVTEYIKETSTLAIVGAGNRVFSSKRVSSTQFQLDEILREVRDGDSAQQARMDRMALEIAALQALQLKDPLLYKVAYAAIAFALVALCIAFVLLCIVCAVAAKILKRRRKVNASAGAEDSDDDEDFKKPKKGGLKGGKSTLYSSEDTDV